MSEKMENIILPLEEFVPLSYQEDYYDEEKNYNSRLTYFSNEDYYYTRQEIYIRSRSYNPKSKREKSKKRTDINPNIKNNNKSDIKPVIKNENISIFKLLNTEFNTFEWDKWIKTNKIII